MFRLKGSIESHRFSFINSKSIYNSKIGMDCVCMFLKLNLCRMTRIKLTLCSRNTVIWNFQINLLPVGDWIKSMREFQTNYRGVCSAKENISNKSAFRISVLQSTKLHSRKVEYCNDRILMTRHRPLSRHLDRYDRVIQNESSDPNGGNMCSFSGATCTSQCKLRSLGANSLWWTGSTSESR